MTELTIMELIDHYRNGKLHDTTDLIDNIYDTCERAVAQQQAEHDASEEQQIETVLAYALADRFDETEHGIPDYPESHEWEA